MHKWTPVYMHIAMYTSGNKAAGFYDKARQSSRPDVVAQEPGAAIIPFGHNKDGTTGLYDGARQSSRTILVVPTKALTKLKQPDSMTEHGNPVA